MYYNKKEKPIIDSYFEFLNENKGHYIHRLYFDNGDQLIAAFLTCADSDNDLDIDDENYEEFHEFYFKILKVEKKSKESNWRKNKNIALNYRNFPVKFELYDGKI